MTIIACSLNQKDLDSRRERWVTLASHALRDIETTGRGLRLVFDRNDGVESELRELAELERDCCPFATWNVDVEQRGLALDVDGSDDEAIPAVQAMFSPLRDVLGAKPA